VTPRDNAVKHLVAEVVKTFGVRSEGVEILDEFRYGK